MHRQQLTSQLAQSVTYAPAIIGGGSGLGVALDAARAACLESQAVLVQ